MADQTWRRLAHSPDDEAYLLADKLHLVDAAKAIAFQEQHGGPMEIVLRAGEEHPDCILLAERRKGILRVIRYTQFDPPDDLDESA